MKTLAIPSLYSADNLVYYSINLFTQSPITCIYRILVCHSLRVQASVQQGSNDTDV